MFIDGNLLDGNYQRFDRIHPATNEVMTTFVEAGARGVDQAVFAARSAFDEGPWPRMRAQS
ncbi:aldehyde dehydrogenase family protein [Caballeronia sp. ATUFL_M2_KS44]|uniref:aldehyde dehydrogenase family protein n=1 Tax=Caballeronia sp. ATUFL_M2_KS44 TaxID=2921767 RepID=UPI0020287D80|nr:aldehyde dehydrogenase family protein [Caballeronia sp. ATUFL_M2_KS44]